MYEVFPAGERFRRDVTLELPVNSGADTSHMGIMLGDGTPNGWRYIGGTYDSQKGVVSVPVTDFGGRRALAAVFTSGSFGPTPADPAANAKLQITAADHAPLITSAGTSAGPSGSLLAFYSDMDSPGEWESLDISGTQLTRVQGDDAGAADGDTVLKVTRLPGGVRLVRVHSTPYDAAQFPILSFDYALPNDYIPDLFVKSNDIWWQLSLGSSAPVDTTYFKSLDVPKLVGDGAWHHYSVDLLSLLQNVRPEGTHFQVSDIVLGQFVKTAYMQVAAADSGQVGSAYYIDNFAALAPTNAANLNLSWAAPSGVSFASYAYGLDPDRSFTPAQQDQGTTTSAGVSLPQNLTDGLYYFHLMAKRADGSWSAVAHLPIMLDRTAPAAGTVASPVDGLGSSTLIELPLADLSGVAAGSIQVKVGMQTYGIGSGLTYDPVLQSIEITPNSLKPAPASLTGGQGVAVTLLAASDHAGNKLAAPYTWSFTADSKAATGDKFRQLTVQGGSSPAISPDGTLLAFVSVRSGTPKIWLMQASDYGEKAAGARALTGAAGSQESDPAWSLDGQTLAYVSNASGSNQVWLTAPDGTGARAVTTGAGGAAGPTWLSDGDTIVFVRDGNLWSVKSDGSELQPVTTYPERPIQSVRAQPRADGQLLAVGFKLYQETVEIYDMATGELRPLTQGGRDREPAWLDGDTIVYTAPAGKQNGGDQQDAIWQVSVYSGGAEPVSDTGVPGVSDSGASTQAGSQDARAEPAGYRLQSRRDRQHLGAPE